MRARTLAFAISLALLAASAIADAHAQVPERYRAAIAKIDALAAAEHARDSIGSVTVGVVAAGALVWTKSYGYADMEAQTSADANTVYRIGSVTKSFTGLMLLQLVQDGKVAFGDPAHKYLPELDRVQKRPSAPVTLLQLATMRAGLPREPMNSRTHSRGPVADWEKALTAALEQTEYVTSPGTRYEYSNVGYAALGAALARAADVPYVRYVEQRILSPLAMRDSAFEPNENIGSRIATGYQIGRSGETSFAQSLRERGGRGYRMPNGGLYSTVGDLARWVSFQLGNGPDSVLSRKVLDESFDRLSWDSARASYGYGIGVSLLRRGRLAAFGHGGDVAGYIAEVRFDRKAQTGVIVLRSANGGRFDIRTLALDALDEVAGR